MNVSVLGEDHPQAEALAHRVIYDYVLLPTDA
jgi:hypothetical protein